MSAKLAKILTTRTPGQFQIELEQPVLTRTINGTYVNVRQQTLRFWLGLDQAALELAGVKDFSTSFDSQRGKEALSNISGITAEKVLGGPVYLYIKETAEPRRTNDGKILSNPKVNPQTNEVLCIGFQPIYRETHIAMEPTASEMLSHDTAMTVDDYNEAFGDQRQVMFRGVAANAALEVTQ